MPEPLYYVHSVVRGRQNRAGRAQLGQRPRLKQFVGHEQVRLVRGRPVVLTETQVRQNLEELRAKVAGHVLEVRTPDGRPVDLDTLTPAPRLPSPPLPHPPLDSIARDTPWGQYVPPNYRTDQLAMPDHVLPPGQKPQLLDHEKDEGLEEQDQKDAQERAQETSAGELELALARGQGQVAPLPYDEKDKPIALQLEAKLQNPQLVPVEGSLPVAPAQHAFDAPAGEGEAPDEDEAGREGAEGEAGGEPPVDAAPVTSPEGQEPDERPALLRRRAHEAPASPDGTLRAERPAAEGPTTAPDPYDDDGEGEHEAASPEQEDIGAPSTEQNVTEPAKRAHTHHKGGKKKHPR